MVCELKVLLKEECFCIHRVSVSCGHICCQMLMSSLILIVHTRHVRKQFPGVVTQQLTHRVAFFFFGFLVWHTPMTFTLSRLPSCCFCLHSYELHVLGKWQELQVLQVIFGLLFFLICLLRYLQVPKGSWRPFLVAQALSFSIFHWIKCQDMTGHALLVLCSDLTMLNMDSIIFH